MDVPIPYNLHEYQLKVEPSSVGKTADDAYDFFTNEVMWDHDEFERMMRAAVVLHTRRPLNTFGECLDTAIIWERG